MSAKIGRPTLDEIRTWPATVNVERAASAIGISRSTLYELIKTGEAPIRTLKVGGTIVVITASLIDTLS
jgi:predicted DNA-binding transcriptional regulator AlpA